MSIKPILFNTEMVRAILDGRKTATRRVVKPQPRGNAALLSDIFLPETVEQGAGAVYEFEDGTVTTPPYHPGDILYVREGAKIMSYGISPKGAYVDCEFQNGERERFYVPFEEYRRVMNKCIEMWDSSDPYKTPNFSPYWLTKHEVRIWLKVIDVRVERLSDMTVDGALREGIKTDGIITNQGPIEYRVWHRMQELWNSTIPKQDRDKYGWIPNPWVWVIEFERCEKPEGRSKTV